jgi:hypothetical protein
MVSHDSDGDWQFLCGTTNQIKDVRIVSLGCIFERDQTVATIADLPEGWTAYRSNIGAEWNREKNEGE